MLTVINKSTLVTDADVRLMVRACASQLRYHAAPLWGLAPVPVVYLPERDAAPAGAWVIAILDDPDQADALGWHTENQGDVVYGRVFARPVLDNGGDALSKKLSVASVLSHEVLETFVDSHCNLWADTTQGLAVAYEVCDPVESDSYPVVLRDSHGQQVAVTVSNFVTPHWFDIQAGAREQFDWMGTVTGPFQMTPGGYVVTLNEGNVNQVFGDEYPEWRKATKQIDVARSARRKTPVASERHLNLGG